MTRAEYEKRKANAEAFKQLAASPAWALIDDFLVDLSKQTTEMPLLSVNRELLTSMYDMQIGRLDFINRFKDAIIEWTNDLTLSPELIEDPIPAEGVVPEEPST